MEHSTTIQALLNRGAGASHAAIGARELLGVSASMQMQGMERPEEFPFQVGGWQAGRVAWTRQTIPMQLSKMLWRPW